MKFLCDEMLQRLGRWLRAAGYDTVIETQGETDRRLLQRALEEGRWLLTRDRKLLEHRGADDTVILLKSDGVEDCVAELTRRMAIDWQYRPFTRCLRCNTPLVAARPDQLQQLPARVRERFDAARYCPRCRQLYWEGSHVRRMRERLRDWQSGSSAPGVTR